MAVLLSASAIGAVIGLAATPLISRLYTPAEFGVFGLFAAALSIGSVVATLRYDYAIPSVSDDSEAASVLVVALCGVVVTSTLCALFFWSGMVAVVSVAAREHAKLLGWSLPLGMAAAGTYAALSNWAVRRRDFGTLSRTKLTQGIAMVSFQVGLGLLGAGGAGLIIGQIAGASFGSGRIIRRIRETDRWVFSRPSTFRLRRTAHRYRWFPLLSGPAVLLDALTGALPLLYLASAFGANTAGMFAMVQRVLLAPLALTTVNFGQVMFGDLADLRRAESPAMLGVFHRRLMQIAVSGIAIIGFMVVVVPVVLPTILGQRWADASTYFIVISPMVFAGFVSGPFGFAVDVLSRQGLHILRDGSRLLVLAIALGISKQQHLDVHATLVAISGAGCVNGIIYLGISWYAIAQQHAPLTIDGGKTVEINAAV